MKTETRHRCLSFSVPIFRYSFLLFWHVPIGHTVLSKPYPPVDKPHSPHVACFSGRPFWSPIGLQTTLHLHWRKTVVLSANRSVKCTLGVSGGSCRNGTRKKQWQKKNLTQHAFCTFRRCTSSANFIYLKRFKISSHSLSHTCTTRTQTHPFTSSLKIADTLQTVLASASEHLSFERSRSRRTAPTSGSFWRSPR